MPRADAIEESLPEQVRRHSKKKVEPRAKEYKIDRNRLIPSGSTLVNLQCSDTIHGAYLAGTMVNIIGDSGSGKTSLALECLAACAQQERFNKHHFFFDDIEEANEFDVSKQFGKSVAARLTEPPNGRSTTVESFRNNILKVVKYGEPFIYIPDSFDALTDAKELERAEQSAAGKELKGSYGMGKAKMSSELFRVIVRDLKASLGLLLLISQVRENIDPMSFKKFTRAGGKALDFYAIHRLWLANRKSIKKKERVVGHEVRVKCDKNKVNGKERIVDYSVYSGYGIDDIGSCIDFMIAEGYWKKKANTIDASDIGLTGTREKLIEQGEAQKLERQLRVAVGDAWMEIEDSIKLDRKAKYS